LPGAAYQNAQQHKRKGIEKQKIQTFPAAGCIGNGAEDWEPDNAIPNPAAAVAYPQRLWPSSGLSANADAK
jgi:hypothetical protein